MTLICMVAASVLSSSLALGATPDAIQTPSETPMARPSAQMPHRSHVPDMTRMPKSYLEATLLYRPVGQATG